MKVIFKNITCMVILLIFFTTSQANNDLNIKKLSKTNWTLAESDHFLIATDVKAKNAIVYLEEMESFRHFVTKFLGLTPIEDLPKIKFILVKRESTFKAMGLGDRTAGMFFSNEKGVFAIAQAPDVKKGKMKGSFDRATIYHELVHYFVASSTNKKVYPLWYSEGLAEYLSTFNLNDDKITLGDPRYLKGRFYSLLSPSGSRYVKPDVEDLFKALSRSKSPSKQKAESEVYKFYARALITTHYLASSVKNSTALSTYLHELSLGQTVDAAFQKGFNKTYESLDTEILDYLNEKHMLGLAFSTKALDIPPINANIHKGNNETSIAFLLNVLLSRNPLSENTKLQKKVNQYLQSMNKNSEEFKLLASEYLLDPHSQLSLSSIDNVLESHPTSARALTIKANILASRARRKNHTGISNIAWSTLIKDARSLYRAAIKADPMYAPAYDGLGHSYRRSLIGSKGLLEAVRCFRSMQIFSPNARYYIAEADARLLMHDYVGAIDPLSKYLELTNTRWKYSYGGFLLDSISLHALPGMASKIDANGKIVFEDGSYYTGEVKNGQPNGTGVLERPSGIKYKGSWLKGLPHGTGELIARHSLVYVGDFNHGAVHGHGKLFYSTDSEEIYEYYEGEFKNNYEHGMGTVRYKDGKMYKGGWNRGMEHGLGSLTLANGVKINAEWLWGHAKLKLKNGGFFIGSLDDDGIPEGVGTCLHNGEEPFSCKVKKGKMISI